jgi:hypothetical protein
MARHKRQKAWTAKWWKLPMEFRLALYKKEKRREKLK